MRSLTWDRVRARRLARNHLLEPARPGRLAEVARDVCGVQAQVMSAAELALGARVAGVTQQGVRDELLERRRLVKTWSIRGTLHLLAADDLPVWISALRARPYWLEPEWRERHGLRRAQAEGLVDAIGEALDGRTLTREELAAEVARRIGSSARQKLTSPWGDLIGPAAHAGVMCFGPPQGARVTFVRLDQWAGPVAELDGDEARAEILRRYLAAYGPATHQEFGRWFSVKPAEARALLESIHDELEQVDVEGYRAWQLAADGEPPEQEPRSVRLLAQYDCYMIGSRPRERLVPEVAKGPIAAHPRGRFEGASAVSVLLVDGVVAGMWERKRRGRRIDLRVEPFVRLTAAQRRAVEAEAARVGAFFDAEISLSIFIDG